MFWKAKGGGKQLFSVMLRLVNLSSKFIILSIIAKFGTTEDVAVFGLYWAGLVIASTLMGWDVYNHTARVILKESELSVSVINRHLGFVIISAIPFPIVAALILHEYVSLPGWLYVVFYLHVSLEFFSQEITRLLIPLKHPQLSVVLSFFRSSFWIFPVVIYIFASEPESLLVSTVLFWCVGSLFSSILAFCFIKSSCSGSSEYIFPKVDFNWIFNSIKSSLIIFFSGMVLRFILSLDKFLIGNMLDYDVLAVYTLYASVIFSLVSMMEVGVSAWRYPHLIEQINSKDSKNAVISMKKFFKDSFLFGVFFFTCISVSFPVYVNYFLSGTYYESINGFYILMCASFIYSLTVPAHYIIYGLRSDKFLLFINLLGLLSMFIWALVVIPLGIMPPVISAVFMLFVSLITISIFRVFFSRILWSRHDWEI